nr:MAG TPA: hypothetical protein [Caudoviricetes sp.]
MLKRILEHPRPSTDDVVYIGVYSALCCPIDIVQYAWLYMAHVEALISASRYCV